MESRKGGASCPVSVTLVREETAGRVSGLGTRWENVTLTSGIKESTEMSRWRLPEEMIWMEKEFSFCRSDLEGGFCNPGTRAQVTPVEEDVCL